MVALSFYRFMSFMLFKVAWLLTVRAICAIRGSLPLRLLVTLPALDYTTFRSRR